MKMAEKWKSKPKKWRIKVVVMLLCQLFCVGSAIWLFARRKLLCGLLALLTVILLAIPLGVEKHFCCSIALPVYFFMLAYALGPLLGDGYRLYHLTSWWDKLLHCAGGVFFAMLGLFLAQHLNRGNSLSPALAAIFALCFSMAVAVLWEFFEYAADRLFAMDMQNDTYLTQIHSYLIGGQLGELGHIKGIESVTVNGMPMEGYLDIGLIDTMNDMLIETVGALGYVLLNALDRGRHPVFQPSGRASRAA
ncbi:MAG: hypothetical protein IJA48_05695 [Oscillospiraceae bacterium]|nr:hypothetical protein [Oscillospiraceae bacterium]